MTIPAPRRPSRLAMLATAFTLSLTLAGCSGAKPPGQDPGGLSGDDGMEAATAAGLQRPEWALRDAWTYDVNGAAATFVITSETASDWIMETDSEERAFSDARDDISRLGPQRKSDLAGSQGEDRVEFFRWPLEAGKSWATRWDQEDVTIRVAEADAQSATMEANSANGTLVYRYTYDAEARWVSSLVHYFPDGSPMVTLKLTDATRNWTGMVVRWQLAEVHADSGSNPLTVGGPFEVPVGTTDLWGEFHFTCTGAAGWAIAVQPANPGLAQAQGFIARDQCTQFDLERVLQDIPQAGTWAFSIDVGGQTVVYDYAILLRTRQDVKIPSA